MSPDLFHVDYERLVETLIVIVILAFFIERSLALLFEHRLYIEFSEGKGHKGWKEPITLIVSFLVCYFLDFDAITIIFQSGDTTNPFWMLLTASVIAGGAKASLALFQDLLHVMSSAEKVRKEAKRAPTSPQPAQPAPQPAAQPVV